MTRDLSTGSVLGAMSDHLELVTKRYRFDSREVAGELWTFSHLEAFAIKIPINLPPAVEVMLDVVFLFSCHCFTRAIDMHDNVESSLIYEDSREKRLLDKERYELSKRYLRAIVKSLPYRHILVADRHRPNYVTMELLNQHTQAIDWYVVFFEVERDRHRNSRMLCRIQSAYLLDKPNQRLQKAQKINFKILLKKAYLKPKSQRPPK
jgi:hypothetical protein